MKRQFVLMAGGGRRQVGGPFKLKNELIRVGRRRNGAHPRLIIRGAIMNERDRVAVHVVEGDHLFHAGHGKEFP